MARASQASQPSSRSACGARAPEFENVDTSKDDVALIAFTSGTTGKPKGTMHFHRDVMAICDCFPRSTLQPAAEDVFIGSPPIGFTFGLGGLVTFPMRVGASAVLLEAAPPDVLLQAIQEFRASVCFTSPTAYRMMHAKADACDLTSLNKCVSAGEPLPLPTFEAWRQRTGLRIIDGIGATEMLHIFLSAADDAIRPGSTGRPIPGYQAIVVDEAMRPLPPGEVGRLAVRGPTGCRYLADERQKEYVRGGWNLTGDAYKVDEAGYFWFQARTDDMIISAGYNIAGPEVEEALLEHAGVAECAVVGVSDPLRGQIVKAFVVPRQGVTGADPLRKELQEFVKQRIAAYKYPRVDRVRGCPAAHRDRQGPALPAAPDGSRAHRRSGRLSGPCRSCNRPAGRVRAVTPTALRPRAGSCSSPARSVGMRTARSSSDDLVEQVRQTLENTLAVLREGGAGPQHVARMTWYVTDKREYLARARELGEAYRALMGRHYPAMAVVEVKALIEDRAKVEIETTAVVPR